MELTVLFGTLQLAIGVRSEGGLVASLPLTAQGLLSSHSFGHHTAGFRHQCEADDT